MGRFNEILAEMAALHDKKGADYGSGDDPYANVRASQEFGVEPWIGALIRLNDKITRLKSFIAKGKLENESVEDSIADIGVYAVIMRVLYEEAKRPVVQVGQFEPEVVKEVFGRSQLYKSGWENETVAIENKTVAPEMTSCVCATEPYCYCGDTRFGDHPGHPVHEDVSDVCYCKFMPGRDIPHPPHLSNYLPNELEREQEYDEKGGKKLYHYIVKIDGERKWLQPIG